MTTATAIKPSQKADNKNACALPAGEYYMGDLCYVLDADGEWDEVCELLFGNGNSFKEGKHQLKDGRKFCVYKTAWGDGSYRSSEGVLLGVDAGMIGIVKVSDIKADHCRGELRSLGDIVTFKNEVSCFSDEGNMSFGQVTVNTRDDDDYDD